MDKLTHMVDDLSTNAGCPEKGTSLGDKLSELYESAEQADRKLRDAEINLRDAQMHHSIVRSEIQGVVTTEEYDTAFRRVEAEKCKIIRQNARAAFEAARDDADEQAMLNCGGTLDATGQVISDADPGC